MTKHKESTSNCIKYEYFNEYIPVCLKLLVTVFLWFIILMNAEYKWLFYLVMSYKLINSSTVPKNANKTYNWTTLFETTPSLLEYCHYRKIQYVVYVIASKKTQKYTEGSIDTTNLKLGQAWTNRVDGNVNSLGIGKQRIPYNKLW